MEVHGHPVVLAAVLPPLRQKSYGTCTAIALGVYIQSSYPILLLKDLIDLLVQGSLSRKIKSELLFFPLLFDPESNPSFLLAAWEYAVFSMAQPHTTHKDSFLMHLEKALQKHTGT